MSEDIRQIKVIKIAQELVADEASGAPITPSLISEKVEAVLVMNPKWREGLDFQAVVDELIRRFSVKVPRDTALFDDMDHIQWLDGERQQGWRYWQRYREWLERDLPWDVVDSLDRSTNDILKRLEDPNRPGTWSRRGLVVGHVQSGKTSNYTGLINKAADANYKIIIVLAGLHNNLRSQTQLRLEEGFLGYQTDTKQEFPRAIGVGQIDSDALITPNCATTRADSGDFSKDIARRLAISPEARPWLFVVKKNKTVLSDLLRWIQTRVADLPVSNNEENPGITDDLPKVKKRVSQLPLLVIDDEADNASVDTQEQAFVDGKPDEEHSPTTINKLIRRILNSFTRSAYVGYTATPFANIFIHERGETRQEGPDLFPSAFIHNLSAPSNYVGPSRVFGSAALVAPGCRLPVVREIDDFCSSDGRAGWMPAGHKATHIPKYESDSNLPGSLVEAIDSFLLACAARNLRGHRNAHASMLIHVTRFTSVQEHLYADVDAHVRKLRQRISRGLANEELLLRLQNLWREDFERHAGEFQGSIGNEQSRMPSWDEVAGELAIAVSDLEVKMINGKAKDALDYADNVTKGVRVIAIGGDKLARGLTLDGLATSYFLRASKMYDTLMQMGRWFGYRPHYLDLTRIYTTSDLVDWFGHIADAADELRDEFDQMSLTGATPRQYGLKVQSHDVLLVTSQLKMHSAKSLMLSFSGRLVQTVSLPLSVETVGRNWRELQHLVQAVADKPRVWSGTGVIAPDIGGAATMWEGLDHSLVCDFLLSFATHPAAYRVNGSLLSEFIDKMAADGELTSWSLVLAGKASASPIEIVPGVSINPVRRAGEQIDDRFSIGTLLDPKDELYGMTNAQWEAALQETVRRALRKRERDHGAAADIVDIQVDMPSGAAARTVRGQGAVGVAPDKQRGLLVIYAIEPPSPDSQHLLGFAISFPESSRATRVEYKVNNVLWESDYAVA